MTSEFPTADELEQTRFCNDCNCAVGLHNDEEGCVCEASEGHPDTLEITDGEEYCKCLRLAAELIIHWKELTHDSKDLLADNKIHT